MRNFELESYFSKWEFNARYHMTASDAQSVSVGELLNLAGLSTDSLTDLQLGYTETWGARDLREAIAATYTRMDAENILCFAGAEEGVYTAMRVLLRPADHAIVITPNYQAAETVPLDICSVTGVPLLEDEHWRLDLDLLKQSIRPETKLVSVCFPNNPTGALPTHAEFAELVSICRTHDLYLFSDEVYRLIELDDKKRIEQVADVYEKGLSLNVMSKAYGLPGLRIGWIATQDQNVLLRLERYKHYLSICNSAPSERLAVAALSIGDVLLERVRSLMSENLVELENFFSSYADLFEWHRPDGGCIAFPKYTGRGSVQTFCENLVEEAGVLLLPASIYRSELLETPQDRFRIGFGRANIKDGLAAFSAFLDAHQDELVY
jgi:aspartate/methionine/tyrosine aminotransferase